MATANIRDTGLIRDTLFIVSGFIIQQHRTHLRINLMFVYRVLNSWVIYI